MLAHRETRGGDDLDPAIVGDPSTAPTRDKAATAVEYGIMIAAIAAVVIAVVIAVGGQVDTALFQKVFENMQALSD